MKAILRASLSLDGRLLTAGGKPRRRPFPPGVLRAASELHLTIHPVIAGGSIPSLSGEPDGFLPKDLRYELLSVARKGPVLRLRYRLAGIKAPPV